MALPAPDPFYPDSLLGRLDRHAGEFPDRTANTFLRDHGDPDTLTFGRLARRVRSLGVRLRERCRPADRVRATRGRRSPRRYYQGLTHAEAGELLGLSEVGVRKRRARARLAVIDRLSPNPFPQD